MGTPTLPRINHASKVLLRYTQDGQSALTVPMQRRDGYVQRVPVILGLNYHFDLQYMLPPHYWLPAAMLVHRFVVTRDRSNAYSVLEHTVKNCPVPADHAPALGHFAIAADHGRWLYTFDNTTEYRQCSPAHAKGRIVDVVPSSLHDPALFTEPRYKAAALHKTFPARHGLPQLRNRHRSVHASVKIVSYNIWNINGHDDGSYTKRLDLLTSQLRSSNADIIALQEVRHDALRDSQPSSITRALPEYQFVFHPAMSYPERVFGRVEEGPAILSRLPILSHHHLLLSRDASDPEDGHQRLCLHVEVALNRGQSIHVFSTHLALSEAARNRSVLEIHTFMNRFPPPHVLLGDMNAEPDTPAMRFLAGAGQMDGYMAPGYFDAYLALHPEPRPARAYEDEDVPRDWGLTFSTLEPQLAKRIDYAFLRLEGTPLRLQDVYLVPNATCTSPSPASDHLGLVVRLSL